VALDGLENTVELAGSTTCILLVCGWFCVSLPGIVRFRNLCARMLDKTFAKWWLSRVVPFRDVAPEKSGDIAAADFFPAGKRDVRRFEGGITRFEQSAQAFALNHSNCLLSHNFLI
jgi:hypothetical protein